MAASELCECRRSPQQAVTALRAGTQKSGAVALRVMRDGHQAFVALSAAPSNKG